MNIDLGVGPGDGRHRVSLLGRGSAQAFASGAAALARSVDATRRLTASHPLTRLECLGRESEEGQARLWLLGSVENWRGLVASRVAVPALTAAERAVAASGGSLEEVRVESRTVRLPDYDEITHERWPLPVSGGGPAVVPRGRVTPAQLAGLAVLLRDALVRERPGWPGDVVERNDGLLLPVPLPRGAVAEAAVVWQQLWWVELDALVLHAADVGPALLADLQAIDWSLRPKGTAEAIPHVQEWLRRRDVLARMGDTDDGPVHDPAGASDREQSEWWQKLEDLISAHALPPFTRAALRAILQWRVDQVTGAAQNPGLTDPWTPLLEVFRLVGPVAENKLGELQVGLASVPWRRRH